LYEWDFDTSDGTAYTDAAGVSPTFDATSLQAGIITIGLRVTDGDDETATDTATVNVGGVAPTVDAGGPYSGNQGENIALSGSASDPSGIDLYEWDLDDNGSYESSGQNQGHGHRDGERRWCGADGGCRRPVQR
jgi:hypothetical protein